MPAPPRKIRLSFPTTVFWRETMTPEGSQPLSAGGIGRDLCLVLNHRLVAGSI